MTRIIKKINPDVLISPNSSIYETLVKINANTLGFVIVVDSNFIVLGVLTDGDMRRHLISGCDLSSKISYDKFHSIDIKHDTRQVAEIFKKTKVAFLPILKQGRLINYITFRQFETLLFEGIEFKPDGDFSNLNINMTMERYDFRPWGYYQNIWISSHGKSKVICINKDSELSLQKHNLREEHWVVLKGNGIAKVEDAEIKLSPGRYIHISKTARHQIINNTESQLIISELQLGDYCGEDDIIRYQDKYNRI